MRDVNLDKAMTRIKKSKAYNQARVDEDEKKAIGSRAFEMKKRKAKLAVSTRRENKMDNEIISALGKQIEDTEEGSKEEQKLTIRRNRLMRSR